MGLSSGTRLGPYEIVAPLGAGGMGEVYRARDTRLGRDVAIKVLPSDLSSDAELKARFEREARVISALQHPHICTLYDIGKQDSVDFLVMEYLEGETLAERLSRGPLPIEKVLRYGIDICQGLEKAHRSAVVHRDLKPGNIMLTKSGAKLMDFGLAKTLPAVVRLSSDLTMTLSGPAADQPLTARGVLAGTFQYMSPEQMEGKEADARSDIFSFGALLYEMVTGKKAFNGKSVASLMAAILEHEPQPISALQPMTPHAMERLVKRCLAKEPDLRWQSAADLGSELEWIVEDRLQAQNINQPRRGQRLFWLPLLALALGVGFLAAYLGLRGSKPKKIHAGVMAPAGTIFSFSGNSPGPPAVSPDGTRIVFAALDSDRKQLLWVRPLDSGTAQPLEGTEGATFPFWSPDNRSIGFFADRKLKTVETTGGSIHIVCDAHDGRGGTWNNEGTIVFAPSNEGALYKVLAAGGTATPVTTVDPGRGQSDHRWPSFLPDGRHFLFFSRSYTIPADTGAYIASLDSPVPTQILRNESEAKLAYPGYLLFVKGDTLMAQPFSTRKLQPAGDAFPLVENVQVNSDFDQALFSVSENGVLAYPEGTAQGAAELVLLNRDGKQLKLLAERGDFRGPVLSPDGKRFLVGIVDSHDGSQDFWIYDLGRDVKTRFTFSRDTKGPAVWSPTGAEIVFSETDKGSFTLRRKASNGAGNEDPVRTVDEGKIEGLPGSWSGDGRYIALTVEGNPMQPVPSEIWVFPFGDRKPYPFIHGAFDVASPRFSPDARWLAYVSNESGRSEIYVTPFPAKNTKVQISSTGGNWPVWRQDGKEIYYVDPAGELTAAEIKIKSSELTVGKTQQLFQQSFVESSGQPFDLSMDGQQFLVNRVGEPGMAKPVTVILNWHVGLRK
jgi:eukaryotic-like serine/threonine-protein kinase